MQQDRFETENGLRLPAPVVPSTGVLTPLGVDAVSLSGGFWGSRQALNASATLPHCTDWIHRSGVVDNFRGHPHRGREFADSDAYKLLEALCWESGRLGGDSALDATIEELARVLAKKQAEDGYLNTLFGAARYTDLEWGHELYCAGHLIQAGVVRPRCHGDDQLVDVVRRVADHVCAEFGPNGRDGVCGHPEIETALVELYRATGEQRYLEQAKLFVERRGHGRLADIELGRAYYQDDVPVRMRTAFSGHAVREFYFACGAVDVAVETADQELLDAVIGQWERTVAARTYLTGASGSRHAGESFGGDFELPSDRAYGETCAAIGSVMLSWRLLLATGEARFADFIERTLFNAVAVSTALDGRSFFYSNPLHTREPGRRPAADRPLPRASTGLRAPWFDVACCPPNVARTVASIGAYQATTDDRGVQLHQLWPSSVSTSFGRVVIETDYPWSGTVTIRVISTAATPWRLSVRVPQWAQGARLNGQPVEPGYAVVDRIWAADDRLTLELPMAPRWTWPDRRIDAVRGTVAVERGPLVYCAESTSFAVDTTRPLAELALPELGGEVVGLSAQGWDATAPEAAWPYRNDPPADRGDSSGCTLLPYHLWGNRGPTDMRVFLPVDSAGPD